MSSSSGAGGFTTAAGAARAGSGLEDGPAAAKRGSTTASVADSGMGTLGSNDSQPDAQVEQVVSGT